MMWFFLVILLRSYLCRSSVQVPPVYKSCGSCTTPTGLARFSPAAAGLPHKDGIPAFAGRFVPAPAGPAFIVSLVRCESYYGTLATVATH